MVPFVYLASVCRSLQCLISALDRSGQSWSLVQVRLFSRAVGREGNCRQMSLACVGSTCSVLATLGLPPLAGVCFPCLHCSGSRLLSRERALSCMHFPGLSRSDSGFLSVGPAFFAFPAREAQSTRSLRSALSPGAARLIPSAVPASVSGRAS